MIPPRNDMLGGVERTPGLSPAVLRVGVAGDASVEV
jgi:hypothetical protein